MNQEELNQKISCLCVTQNRVELLKQSIEYFKSQTYTNKEMVIVFEKSDISTAQYVYDWVDVCHIKVNVTNTAKDNFFIYSEDDRSLTNLRGGEKIKINLPSRGWLANNHGRSIGIEDDHRFKHCIFELEKSGGLFKIKTNDGSYLRSKTNGSIDTTIHLDQASFFDFKSIEGCNYQIIASGGTYLEFDEANNVLSHGHLYQHEIIGDQNSKIRFIEVSGAELTLGLKRNLGIEYSTGEYIAIWDDDDWHAPERLEMQYLAIRNSRKVACTLTRLFMFDHSTKRAYATSARRVGWEGSLLCKKENFVRYEHLQKGEDTSVLYELLKEYKLKVIMEPQLYIYNVHGKNTWDRDHFIELIFSSVRLDKDKTEWIAQRAKYVESKPLQIHTPTTEEAVG